MEPSREERRSEEGEKKKTVFGKGVFDDNLDLDGALSGLEKAARDALIGVLGRIHKRRADAGLNARREVVVVARGTGTVFFFFETKIVTSLCHFLSLLSFWTLCLFRALEHSFFFAAPCPLAMRAAVVASSSHTTRAGEKRAHKREQPRRRKRTFFFFFRWLA